jgi:hypothetical protein
MKGVVKGGIHLAKIIIPQALISSIQKVFNNALLLI